MVAGITNPVEAALSNPWKALGVVLDGPLHPGGEEATADLLDRADVSEDTRLLDAGCGAGDSVELARRRGAVALGVDKNPPQPTRTVRGDLDHLPVEDSSFDVVLSECSICLSSDLSAALSEARRVIEPGGRLALSDVTVDDDCDLSSVPDSVVGALCLDGDRDRNTLLRKVEEAGFDVRDSDVCDHRDDLLRMRDEVESKVDYRSLLTLMGERGRRILDGVNELEEAVEDGRVGYVSVVATAE